MFENKFDFKNQRRKPTPLAVPLFASNSVNLTINKKLLTVVDQSSTLELLQTIDFKYNSRYDHCYLSAKVLKCKEWLVWNAGRKLSKLS